MLLVLTLIVIASSSLLPVHRRYCQLIVVIASSSLLLAVITVFGLKAGLLVRIMASVSVLGYIPISSSPRGIKMAGEGWEARGLLGSY